MDGWENGNLGIICGESGDVQGSSWKERLPAAYKTWMKLGGIAQ